MLQSIIGWCNWTDARFSQLMSLHNCFCPICCSFADPIFQTSCKLKMEETSFNTNRRKVTDWDERATWWTRPTTTSSPCPTRSPTSSTLTSTWKVVWRDIQEENNWTYIENMLKIIAHVYNILTIHAVVVFLALFKNGTLRMKVRSPTKWGVRAYRL